MSIKTEKISCPTCAAKHTWKPENEFRPFCSSRCKLIDLGEWASEGHKIPGDPVELDKLQGEDDSEDYMG
jgi:endogenous inhibitor of DNA gyrase (YacG/DUF329 family)